jgi:uncharacterized protein
MSKTVAILGASANPERFAFKAYKLLEDFGHKTHLVNPARPKIENAKVYATLEEIKTPIDTLTLYVGPKISATLEDSILKLHPQRVIFNPGTENPELEKKLRQVGIETVEGCTLVMLRSNAF